MSSKRPPNAAPGRPRRNVGRLADRLVLAALVVLTLAVTIPLDGDYGLTYDEGLYMRAAQLARMWFGRLASDPGYALSEEGIAEYWESRDYQPGTMKVVGAITWAALPFLPVTVALRAATALMLCIGIAAIYGFARRAFGPVEAAFAPLALLSMPRVFAHTHFMTQDVAVMSLSFATLYLAWRAGESDNWPRAILAGVCFGAAIGAKVNGFFVPVILLIAAPFWVLAQSGWPAAFDRQRLRTALLRALRVAVCLIVIGPIVFFLLWPWLWHHTWQRVRDDYIGFHLRHYRVSTVYFGREYPPQHEEAPPAPWHYPFVMTAVTTPLPLLLLALLGIGWSWRLARKMHFATLLLLVGLLVNFAFSALPNSPKYNGVRLFLPVFPFIAIFAARGLRRLMSLVTSRLGEHTGRLRGLCYAAAGALVLIPSVRALAAYYPHHLAYYNALLGGTKGAVARGLPPTYWGEPVQEGFTYIVGKAEEGTTVWVAPPGMVSIVKMYCPPGFEVTDGASPPIGASYAVFALKPNEIHHEGCQSLLAQMDIGMAKPEYTVRTPDGVPLVYVFGPKAVRRTQIERALRPSLGRR